MRPLVIALSLVAFSSLAADAPRIPSRSIAEKKELLFSDDMEGTEHDKRWHRVVDTFAFENGALKGTQTRVQDMPSKDGMSIIKAHAAGDQEIGFLNGVVRPGAAMHAHHTHIHRVAGR